MKLYPYWHRFRGSQGEHRVPQLHAPAGATWLFAHSSAQVGSDPMALALRRFLFHCFSPKAMPCHAILKGLGKGARFARFWKVLREFSQEQRAWFLQFATGTSRVPVEGFKGLVGMRGPQKFCIHRAYGPERLPSAHTCFNQPLGLTGGRLQGLECW